MTQPSGWISEFETKRHFALIIPNQSSLRFIPCILPIVDFNALASPRGRTLELIANHARRASLVTMKNSRRK